MTEYIIVTDNMADLPEDYCRQHDLRVMYLSYTMDGITYDADNRQDEKEFYTKMREGSMPVSSQITPETALEAFREYVKVCKTILCISFSSGLSGTYSSVTVGAQQMMEEDPSCRIEVIDSLAASMGQGLLVHKALMMKESGAGFEEVLQWVKDNRLKVVHNFTVEDLFHLHRGGRVSKTAAILGTMVQIKPMLHVDNEGHLINIGKVRGRKKSIQGLEEAMERQIGSWRDKNDIVFISHGDCPEDAQYLADLIRERLGIENFLINYVGPTIGTHSGPGTLALFYMGDYR